MSLIQSQCTFIRICCRMSDYPAMELNLFLEISASLKNCRKFHIFSPLLDSLVAFCCSVTSWIMVHNWRWIPKTQKAAFNPFVILMTKNHPISLVKTSFNLEKNKDSKTLSRNHGNINIHQR